MPVLIHRTFPITDIQAGALLGLKGDRIQRLQLETGAIINIDDFHDDKSERQKCIVNVQGSERQVNNALQAIGKILMINNGDNFSEETFKGMYRKNEKNANSSYW